ncbi:hypothetical protein QQS21_003009 [Conoideocrella luteorostrata]|uniref:BPL/LPL catalytic domain-containing protein n=1 Tax=Conoideocrella luteorostrata TaxID=1105319 RepID=A0AAJ0CU17_9HYPO|nr:hypothetical protein QQS21_003009 [Conoideocrella luteorostrata]
MQSVAALRCGGIRAASRLVQRAACLPHICWLSKTTIDVNPAASAPQRWAQSKSGLSVLEHVHLTGNEPAGLVSYDQAEAAQEEHRARFLAWKALSDDQKSISTSEIPKPRLVSFEAMPTYTLGRRQEDLMPDQTARLQRTLEVGLPHRRPTVTQRFNPQVKKTSRGGLTTYHGPGQIVLWPIIDMHSPLYPKYGVASYASHLETTTQRLLSEIFGIQTYVARDEPGVWVAASSGQPRKIAALGVHHRRYVTALGIAVNIDIPVTGSETVNPWARFVPCGLDGKLVTSVAAEVGNDSSIGWNLEDLAGRWAILFEEGLLDERMRNGGNGDAESRLRR